ncbi:hypothetical protein LNP74_20925 [Klebsiella pneumoniae subsp. pneumoniae]|nr:hypothetical protein [Klebsiella pneumoniae subsp. pneumoniae]
MKPEEIRAVEDLVNAQIRRNLAIETNIMDIDAARVSGAMALFGEYDDRVRSADGRLPHPNCAAGLTRARTGDIGLFRITSESGTAAGVSPYRSGDWRRRWLSRMRQSDQPNDISLQLLKGDSQQSRRKVRRRAGAYPSSKRELQQLKEQAAAQESANLSSKAEGD